MASNLGHTLLIPARGASTAAIEAAFDLFLDRFASPGVPSASRTAVPGHGKVVFTNPTEFELIDGWLRKGNKINESTWGDQRAVLTDDADAGFTRAAGRTFTCVFAPEDRVDWGIGWVTAVDETDPRTDGHCIVADGTGTINVSQPGEKVALVSGDSHVVRALDYFLGVTLNDQGAVYWISTFAADSGGGMNGPLTIPAYPTARILFVTTEGTTTPLFPGYYPLNTVDTLKTYYNGNAFDTPRVVDVTDWAANDALATFADRFTRANSTTTLGNSWVVGNGTVNGVWGIVSNQGYYQSGGSFPSAYHTTPSADGLFVYELTLQSDTQNAWITLRHAADNEYIRIGTNGTNNTAVVQHVLFVGTTLTAIDAMFSGPVTWVAGVNRIVVAASGNQYRLWVNGTAVGTTWQTDANDYCIAGTGMGAMLFDAGTGASAKLDNYAFYPHTFTIPTQVQDYEDYLAPKTEGAATITDTFTAANGTTLSGRTTTTGSKTWTVQEGTWTINSNKVASALDGDDRAWLLADTDDYWASVDLTMPASWNVTETLFAGLVLAGVDDNNLIAVRAVADQDDQPQDDEVEIVQFLAGSGAIEHKVQMGADVYALNGTYTLKCHNILVGDDSTLIRVFLDGKPRISYLAPFRGRRVGLYQSEFDSGATFDNFQVGPLT